MYIVIACDKIRCRQFWILRFKNIEIIKIFQKYVKNCQNLIFLPQNNCLGVVKDNVFIIYIVFVYNDAML